MFDEKTKDKKQIEAIGPKIVKEIIEIPAMGTKAMELMDAEDSKAIINAELLDETVKAMVYKAKDGNSTLTINGIFEAARRFKNIRARITKIEKLDTCYMVYASAYNKADNLEIELAYEGDYLVMSAQGKIKDIYALQKAQAKALRNAIKKVIPTDYFNAIIKRFLSDKKGS